MSWFAPEPESHQVVIALLASICNLRRFMKSDYNEISHVEEYCKMPQNADKPMFLRRVVFNKVVSRVASKAVEVIPAKLQELVLRTKTMEVTNNDNTSSSNNSSSSPSLTEVVKMDLDLVLVLTATIE